VRDDTQIAAIARGGYVLLEPPCPPEALIIATGSEVETARAVAQALNDEGRAIRVVSMPCVDAFERQDAAWREAVLPAALTRRIAVEAGSTAGWYRYIGLDGLAIGLDHFGASAPANELFARFGLDIAGVTAKVRAYLA